MKSKLARVGSRVRGFVIAATLDSAFGGLLYVYTVSVADFRSIELLQALPHF